MRYLHKYTCVQDCSSIIVTWVYICKQQKYAATTKRKRRAKKRYKLYSLFVRFLVQQPPVGQGLLIHEDSRSHTATHHSR
jgi:hypothetical protein